MVESAAALAWFALDGHTVWALCLEVVRLAHEATHQGTDEAIPDIVDKFFHWSTVNFGANRLAEETRAGGRHQSGTGPGQNQTHVTHSSSSSSSRSTSSGPQGEAWPTGKRNFRETKDIPICYAEYFDDMKEECFEVKERV